MININIILGIGYTYYFNFSILYIIYFVIGNDFFKYLKCIEIDLIYKYKYN